MYRYASRTQSKPKRNAAQYSRKYAAAQKLSAQASTSMGRITPKERTAIRKMTMATRSSFGAKEARVVKQTARRKARKS